ncbi:O-antigen ligase family protein [candidate division KSB1 bacterium]|nr:O-antigen ligase family protein [candidate division KSB1 bacterium]
MTTSPIDIYPRLHARSLFIATMGIVTIAALLAITAESVTYLKSGFILLAGTGLVLILLNPEYGLLFSFSSAIFKEWLYLNVPFFAQFDFTLAIFLLTMVSVFYYLIKNNYLFDIRLPASALPLLLFSAFMIFSVIYSLSFKYGSYKSFSFLFFNWALFLFPILVIRDQASAIKLFKGLIVVAILVALFTIVSLIKSVLSKSIIFTYRSSFLEVNPISYANWIGAIAIMFLVMIPLVKKKIRRIFCYMGLLALVATIFAANSRGPMVSFVVVLTILMAIRYRGKPKRNLLIWSAVGVVVVILLLLVLPEQVTSRYTDVFTQEERSKNLTFFTVNTRLYNWQAAWNMATDSIIHFLFGVGSGGFSQMIYRQDIRWYPHNIFLEVFCELGLIGTVLLLWHFAGVAATGLKAYKITMPEKTKAIFLAVILAAIFNFIGAQFSGDLNDNRRLWFFLGLVIALSNLTIDKQATADGRNS